jgi:hypothetical protein
MNLMMVGFLLKFLFSKIGLVISGIVAIISFDTGTNPLSFLGNNVSGGSQGFSNEQNYPPSAADDRLAEFSAKILADTEIIWNQELDNY